MQSAKDMAAASLEQGTLSHLQPHQLPLDASLHIAHNYDKHTDWYHYWLEWLQRLRIFTYAYRTMVLPRAGSRRMG